jgi:hypothetical protein
MAICACPYAVAAHGAESAQAGYGRVLLQLGVLAVVVAAPLGAAAVALTGERLLTKQGPEPPEVDAEAGDGGGLKPRMSIERMSIELEPTAAPRL